jgi:hypothetical protein
MPYLLPLTFVSFQLKSIYYFLNLTILKKNSIYHSPQHPYSSLGFLFLKKKIHKFVCANIHHVLILLHLSYLHFTHQVEEIDNNQELGTIDKFLKILLSKSLLKIL